VSAAFPSVNLGPPHISETNGARKLKFYTHLDGAKYSFQVWNFSARGCGGRKAPQWKFGTPSYFGNYWSYKVEIVRTFRPGQVLFLGMKLFPLGACGGDTALPSVNIGPSNLGNYWSYKVDTHLDRPSAFFGYEIFSTRVRAGGAAPPS